MNLHSIKHLPLIHQLIRNLWMEDAENKVARIYPFIQRNDKILEVGVGLGTIWKVLKNLGFEHVDGLDLANNSWFPDLQPIVYDGTRFSIRDKSYDVISLLTVLHHAKLPEHLIQEAKRVGRRIIVIEDVYKNQCQKYLTLLTDSLINLEFRDHPHQNKTTDNWLFLFKAFGLGLVHLEEWRYFGLYRQALFVLKT
jgi:ubiquinone/menaquinone biosynthesis C-methylase UbiE